MPISGVITSAGRVARAKGLVGTVAGVPIQNVISYFVYGEGGFQTSNVVGEVIGTGTGSQTDFTLGTANDNVQRGTLTVVAGAVALTDDGNGNLVGIGATGTIFYKTGVIQLAFSVAPVVALSIVAGYSYRSVADVPLTSLVRTRAQDTPVDPTNPNHLAWFKKNFALSGNPLKSYVATPSPRFHGEMFLEMDEFLDDGRGASPVLYEVGAFDSEDQMIVYATFDPITKTGSTTVNKKVNLIS